MLTERGSLYESIYRRLGYVDCEKKCSVHDPEVIGLTLGCVKFEAKSNQIYVIYIMQIKKE